MGLFGFLERKEQIVGIDIGSTGVKLVELDLSGAKPKVLHLASAPVPADAFSNYVISKPEAVSEQITKLLEARGVKTRLAATSVPGPSVFTKRIKMPTLDREELAVNINLEAANFIPHNIDAVKLDYHVIGESGKNQLDVLVVAIKTEILESYLEALLGAGVEAAVVDVDTFALQNAFELGYSSQMAKKTTALVNIGARYAAVNICRDGQSLFAGDVAVGGKSMTEGIATELTLSMREAEEQKRKGAGASDNVKGAIKKQIEQMATELNRQLSFFWNASGAEEGIDQILLSGGGVAAGLVEALNAKTGIACAALDPFKGVEIGGDIDPVAAKTLAPFATVATGLALRQPGDKIYPEGM